MGVGIDQRRGHYTITKVLHVWRELFVKGIDLGLDRDNTIAAHLDARRLHPNPALGVGQDHATAIDLHRCTPFNQS